MDALSVDTRRADAYLEDGPGSIQRLDGRMFFLALGSHDQVVADARTNVTNAERLLGAVARNLQTAQTRYDQTEQDNVVSVSDIFSKLDSANPTRDLGAHGSADTFGTLLPGAEIPGPENFEGVPEWAQLLIELGGSLVSPGYWANKIIEWTFGVNPQAWFVEQFTGDWQGVTMAGDAFTKVGDYWTAMATTLADDCGVLFRGWEGEAADSAQSYFQRLIEAHAQMAAPLAQIGSQYHACGVGMYFTAAGVGALLGTLMDMVAGAAVLAAAIAVATASGVGAPAALVMIEGLLVWLEAIMGVWATVLTIQGVTVGVAYTVAGLIAGYLGNVKSIDQMEMPSEG